MTLLVHSVVAGDTLWEIAQLYGLTVEALLAANPWITDRSLIRVGDSLTVPPRVVDLAKRGGYPSDAVDINDRGQVVGQVQTASGQWHAFLWQDGAMTDLGTLGGNSSSAHGVNNLGQVVGTTTNATNAGRGFLWQDGVMTDLGTLGGVIATVPADVNDRGQVVGAANTSGEDQHAFLWQGGTMTDLGTLGGTWSFANGVNNRGQVVGASSLTGGFKGGAEHAFLWQDRVMTDLGTLGGSSSFASAINDRGQVVGASTTAGGAQHAFLWQDGVMTDLGTLDGRSSGAEGINECGQVVGWDYARLGEQAVLWEKNGQILALGTPGEGHSGASAINDQGQAVGTGPTASGHQSAQNNHAILWVTAIGGWPTVGRAGLAMSGAVEDSFEMDGRLRLSITVTGLASGQAVSLRAAGRYAVTWACGVTPEPCGELGCPPTSYRDTEGMAKATTQAVARSDGAAAARIEIVAAPPAEACPTDSTASWGTFRERWEKVRIADPGHGLILTPDTIERGITF